MNSEKTSAISCSDTLKYKNLVLKSINLPSLQQYYDVQDNLNQEELIVLNNNKHLNKVKGLYKFNKQIVFLDSNKIKRAKIKAYLEYKEISIILDTAKIYYRYDAQGVGIKSVYLLKDCDWLLVKSNLWEN
ncbi:hypothetical protein [Maribacter sp. 2308TA10-17]|uniref:hypothetical protein n=1 Tax=Maribacter sp. 2308TA10-17 TaxID=3386276 RepID=UPI0039BD42B7